MWLDDRYELLALVGSGPGALFVAKERESGRELLVRFLPPGPAADVLKELLPSNSAGVIRVEHGRLPLLVTADRPEWRNWSGAAVRPAQEGEFTRMFKSMEAPIAPPPAARAAPPGEFTAMFLPPEPRLPSMSPPTAPLTPDPLDEFSQFFNQPLAANPSALPTRFGDDNDAPRDRPFAGPSEFTRLFGGTQPVSLPPPSQPGSGGATGVFGSSGSAPQGPFGAPAPQGPSEYTLFLGGGPKGGVAPEPRPAPSPIAPVAQARTPLPGAVVAILVAIMLLLVTLAIVKVFG